MLDQQVSQRWPRLNPVQVLRHAPRALTDPAEWLAGVHRTYGPDVLIELPGQTVAVVGSAVGVDAVLRRNRTALTKETLQYRALDVLTDGGMLTSDEVQWRQARAALQPAFHAQRSPRLVEHTVMATRDLLSQWEVDQELEVEPACLQLALTVLARATLGLADAADLLPLSQMVIDGLAAVVRNAKMPLPGIIPTPDRAFLHTLRSRLVGVSTQILQAEQVEPGGVVELLRDAPSTIDPVAELITMIIAGHETVAASLSWTLILLAREPQWCDRVIAEVAAVTAGQPVQLAHLPALVHTSWAVSESLRLYPPAWVLSRTVVRDVDVGCETLRRGSLVVVSPYAIHRGPAYENPGHFVPQRFCVDPPRNQYIPFGLGSRLCIGRNNAMQQLVAIVATVAQWLSEGNRRLQLQGGVPASASDVTLRPSVPVMIVAGHDGRPAGVGTSRARAS